MHITIFEEKDFIRWCQKDIQEHKEAILKRACSFLLCSITSRKDMKGFSDGEDILFSNLDLIEINYEVADDNKIFNTCLADKCLTILYDDIAINDICSSKNISYHLVEIFFNKLSNFVTDSAIIEWKLFRGLSIPCVKVENPKFGEPCFFPVSYYLLDLILVLETLTGKRVKFSPNETAYATITKDDIVCYFSSDRLETEYLIAEQLIKVYLSIKGFKDVDKYYFTDMKNWLYDEETLNMAMHILLQNKYTGIMISDLYPIYTNPMIYSLMNFRSSEEYMSAVCRYLCSYSKKYKLCSHCSGIDDIFNQEGTCPLYKDDSIMDRFFLLSEIATPEQHDLAVKELVDSFLLD